MIRILDCINTELANLSEHPSWQHADIPTLTTIVVVEDGEPSAWMCKQMREQMRVEPTKENYERYLIKPVHGYEHWKEVINEIIQSSNW